MQEGFLMKNKIKIIAVLVCLVFLVQGVIAAEDNAQKDIEDIQEEILEQAEEILSSDLNVNASTQLLAALEEPEEKPVISIYEIADETGQTDEMGSRVITQGAEDMLITALMRSRQFVVIDRINNNLMTEFELKDNNLLAAGEGPELGELSGADYILEGAVTEYQVDKKTEGLGIAIGGIGASKEHAVASTALDLRLVDTTSGEVVWARSLKDEIKGEKIGIETFSFMGENVVEFETGEGKQEVINLVVRTLLEEGVFKLAQSDIIE